MKAATRKKLLAYAIPVDLVVVATGAGLVVPSIPLLALIAIFVAAVALSAWKSGWVGGLAAMVISAVALFALFSRTIHGEEIAWFVAASVVISFPLAAWGARRRAAIAPGEVSVKPAEPAAVVAKARSVEETAAAALRNEVLQVERPEHTKITPVRRSVEEAAAAALRDKGLPVAPPERPKAVTLTQSVEEVAAAAFIDEGLPAGRSEHPKAAPLTRSVEETAAAALIDRGLLSAEPPVLNERQIAAREAHARDEGERAATERFAIEKKKIEEDGAQAREQFERELAERFERRRVELQSGYERDRVALKVKFDALRLELDAERVELQKQLDEERGRQVVSADHAANVDEEAILQRLEHLRAELQQQFERELQPRIDAALASQRQALDRDAQREIEKARSNADERVATFRAELERVLAEKQSAPSQRSSRRTAAPVQAPRGIFRGLFSRQTTSGENTATRRAAAAAVAESSATRRARESRSGERKARVLFLESRRATADTAAPRLRQLDMDIVIVERLIDAVDELYRFRPDVLFIDADLPDFENAYKTIAGQAKNLPLVLSARNASSIPDFARAGVAIRPYAIDEIVELARTALGDPKSLLARQNGPRAQEPARTLPVASNQYDIVCSSCGVVFDATEADWCSCLTRDRTVVCTNCLTCFCKAAPAYKETFWLEAPPRIIERRAAENRRQHLAIAPNLSPGEVKRPLVMLVEDDEEIQAVMQRVCANLGYGSVSAGNGQDGLDLARTYRPNLILTDAFLPKLDGREMCRQLKQKPAFAGTKMVVMTGLYADSKFKAESVRKFGIDDFLVKPVSITDLINLMQRHLEGVLDLPAQENLYDLHRKGFDPGDGRNTYEVACFTCGDMFDSVKAEWCAHAGPDSTLVCEHCGNCFCNAAEYRARFWAGAPAILFERKTIRAMRDQTSETNPPPESVKRPLIALLEDDEATQLLVRTVVSTLGYGFIVSKNADDARSAGREYKPDLFLVDAWMPNLDGRAMCRELKGDGARVKTIVMTGRYADQAYRQEAQSQFNVDDCVPKPLAVSDLLGLVRKHVAQEVPAK